MKMMLERWNRDASKTRARKGMGFFSVMVEKAKRSMAAAQDCLTLFKDMK